MRASPPSWDEARAKLQAIKDAKRISRQFKLSFKRQTGLPKMKSNQVFPSQYMNAADIGKTPLQVVIEDVSLDTVGQGTDAEQKPVMHFQGGIKKLVLNKTNWNACVAMFGDESDDWKGKPITLRSEKVAFKGDWVDSVRVVVKEDIPF